MKRHRWIELLSFAAGVVLAYAPLESRASAADPAALPTTESQSAESTAPATSGLDPWLNGPEIWRLPPVASAATPPALALPPVETIPTPPPSEFSVVPNAPLSLPSVLADGNPVSVTPSPDEVEKLWEGTFNLGMDGAEGNSQTTNFHFGFHANRKHETNILTLGVDYNKQTAYTNPTTDRLFFDGRFEWLIHGTRWSWFLHETIEYDEFQPFDVRDTSDVGLGYRLIRNADTTFISRLGGGFSHEYGGPDNGQFVPEIVFGLQLDHKISKRQKILGSVEYAPDVGNFLRYRIRSQAAWEVLLDEERNLSLRMGVLERYNSKPGNALRNDLDYALMLMWKI